MSLRPTNKGSPGIRERLRQWAIDNGELLQKFEIDQYADDVLSGSSHNSLSRPQSTVSSSLEIIGKTREGMSGLSEDVSFRKQDLEVGVDSTQPGDLVEMRYRPTNPAVIPPIQVRSAGLIRRKKI